MDTVLRYKNFLIFLSLFLLLIFFFYIHDSKQKISYLITQKKRHVFFDLGANRGDTIQKFFDGKLIDMKDFNSVKWIIHAFEPNPTFNEKLIETKKKFSPEKAEILLNLETAAWIKNGKMDLYFDGSTNSEGTSLFKNHPAVKKDGSITVKTVDIADRFV